MFAKSTFIVQQPKRQKQKQRNVLNRETDKRDTEDLSVIFHADLFMCLFMYKKRPCYI